MKKKGALLLAVLLTATVLGACNTGANNGADISSSSTVSDSITVKEYTLQFDSNGGSAVDAIKVEKGDKAEKPADPTKDGYIFAGWVKDGVLFDFESKINGDVTLTAQWRVYGIDYELSKNEPLNLANVIDGEIEKVVLDNIDITSQLEEGAIPHRKASAYGVGVHTLRVETAEKAYDMELTIADYVIFDTDSFLEYYNEVKTIVVTKTQILKKQLYVVLSDDFTYEGTGVNVWPSYNNGEMNGVQTGVFDGRGHTIKGLIMPNYSLFSVIQGEIKNVAFVDVESRGKWSYGILSRFIWGGRLENVYISGQALNGVEDVIAGGISYSTNAPVIKNCIINVDFGYTQGAVFYNSGVGEEEQTTFENVYAISGMKTALAKDGGGWEVFPYADVEFFGFVEMNMGDSLFENSGDHLYFNQKKLF